jgi:nucleotide-binding universal stress UspA family protein
LSDRQASWQDSFVVATPITIDVRRQPGEPMSKKRRSYEAGHSPKFLVVIDDTPECDRAVYFASRRALRIGATVIMLRVIEMHDRNQQWLGVGDIMRAEAHEEANAVLDRYAARASSITGVMPDRVIREGDRVKELFDLIEEDEDIAILVLAAGTAKEGPGPLVASLASSADNYPIPIAIVPGHLSDEDLDTMS